MMLTVLIADDEQHIRDGIRNSIPWNELQIDKVLQAIDGQQAFEIAGSNKVDILITDIRMPRMDGIQLSRSFRKMYPDCIIIFMSAYSDREYLISAIELKCNHFIEKPIQIEELQKAIKESVKTCQEAEYSRLRNIIVKNNMKISIPLIKNEIALLVTNKRSDGNLLSECIKNEMLDIASDTPYITVLVHIFNSESTESENMESNSKINLLHTLKRKLESEGLECFYGTRDEEEYIVHITGGSSFSKLNNQSLSQILKEWYLQVHYKKIFVSIGSVVPNFMSISQSYAFAKSALNKCFFKGYGSIVYYSSEMSEKTAIDSRILDRFTEILESGKRKEIYHSLQEIHLNLQMHENIKIEDIKNLYYKLALLLSNRLQIYGASALTSNANDNSLRNQIFASNTLEDINIYANELLEIYLSFLEKISNSNSILSIINFIEKQYSESSLDVNMISQNTFLSPAYLCTYFKKETGKTLNQYINEYRLTKAVEFLKDKKYRISEVAGLTGYGDGNYFARVFKKKYGVTPSEYRERLGMMI